MATNFNLISFFKTKAARSVVIYTFTNFFGKAAAFILLVVFTNPAFITPSENGLLALFSNSILLLMPFLSMGIVQSTGAEYFKTDKKEFRDLFMSGFAMALAVMVVSILGLVILQETLYKKFQFPSMFAWLIPLMAFLIFCNDQLLNIARSRQDTAVYLRSNILKVGLELGISVVLVVLFAWHWQGRITGLLCAYTIMALHAFYYFSSHGFLGGSIRTKHVRSELVYAVPIIALQVSTFCMGSSDRFFLSEFASGQNEVVGIYNVAATFGSVVVILCTAMLQYIFPRIYLELSKPVVDYSLIRRSFGIYLGVMLAGALLLMLIIPFAYRYFIHERYHSGLEYVFILCGGYFFWTIAYFFFSFLLYYKEKKKILFLSLCGIITSLVFNYYFIRAWGEQGAAAANLATYFIVLLITLIVTRSYWRKFLGHSAI